MISRSIFLTGKAVEVTYRKPIFFAGHRVGGGVEWVTNEPRKGFEASVQHETLTAQRSRAEW